LRLNFRYQAFSPAYPLHVTVYDGAKLPSRGDP
jgi:hypothetical protein